MAPNQSTLAPFGILLIGKTGEGKTTLYNYLTGATERAEAGGSPITRNCCTKALLGYPNIKGIDTVGFGDLEFTDQQVRSMVIREVGKTPGLLVNLILLVVRFPCARMDRSINELLERTKVYAAGLTIKFFVTNPFAQDWVREMYPEHPVICMEYDRVRGYSFDPKLLVDACGPGVNLRVNPKTCGRCCRQFFAEDEEACHFHSFHFDHPRKPHVMVEAVTARTTKYRECQSYQPHVMVEAVTHRATKHKERRHHIGNFGGFLNGWSCCGKGRYHTEWNYEDCHFVTLEPYVEETKDIICDHCRSPGTKLGEFGQCPSRKSVTQEPYEEVTKSIICEHCHSNGSTPGEFGECPSRQCDCGTPGCHLRCTNCHAEGMLGVLTHMTGCLKYAAHTEVRG